eukprot:c9310_g1_i3.p1 GENE.c9310_g1_i3~~c9310_g1_i3.p1  ORF type:complete len:385 (+),score=127.84 c9310_g1_i3:98-1252(+)
MIKVKEARDDGTEQDMNKRVKLALNTIIEESCKSIDNVKGVSRYNSDSNDDLQIENERVSELLEALHHKNELLTLSGEMGQQLLKELEELQTQLDHVTLENSDLRERVYYDTVRRKSEVFEEKCNTPNSNLEDECDHYREQLGTTENENRLLLSQIKELRKEREQLEDITTQLDNELEHIKIEYDEKLNGLTNQVQELRNENDFLQQENQQVHSELEICQQHLESANQRLKNQYATITQLQEQFAQLTLEADHARLHESVLLEEKRAMEAKLNKLINSFKSYEIRTQQVQQQLQQFQQVQQVQQEKEDFSLNQFEQVDQVQLQNDISVVSDKLSKLKQQQCEKLTSESCRSDIELIDDGKATNFILSGVPVAVLAFALYILRSD